MSTASDPWGRVAEDGTVYVRTAEGERQVGSWQAGSPDEALAFFKRKFDDARDRGQPAGAAAGQHRPVAGPGQGDDRAAGHGGHRRARHRRPGRAAGAPGGADRRDGHRRRSTRPRARRPAARRRRSRSGSSPRPSGSRPRPRTGRSAASGCASSWRSGRPRRAATGRPRPRCGSGCPRPATRSPSGARPTSPAWRRSARGSGRARRTWPARPRRCPPPPTGRPRRPPTAS